MSSKPTPSPFQFLGIGFTIAVCLVAGMGGGYWLGEKIGASLLLMFVGMAVGTATAVLSVRAEIRKYM
ncbi:MAG: AtpZ/AtpI family protein [Acidimicrobiales bacterium]